jgi:DNA-binding NtrC family response regulator
MGELSCLILLVEDDDDVRATVRAALDGFGCAVIEARDAEEALRLLVEERRISVLFTDIRMPGLLDGIGLAREARRRHPGLKVLYTTAHAAAVPDTAVEESEGGLLAKPYRLSELRQRIYNLIAP